VLSGNRRVLGMMPHPERAIDPALGGADGTVLFNALVASWRTPDRGAGHAA
jgi:phosphoribosylformylglycinamidine synthase subunit PurQ / glutaminase